MSEGKKRGAREERGAQDFGGLSGEARGILDFSQPNSWNRLTEWTEVLDREQKFRWYSHGEVFEFGCYRGKSKFYGCYIGNFLIEI